MRKKICGESECATAFIFHGHSKKYFFKNFFGIFLEKNISQISHKNKIFMKAEKRSKAKINMADFLKNIINLQAILKYPTNV